LFYFYYYFIINCPKVQESVQIRKRVRVLIPFQSEQTITPALSAKFLAQVCFFSTNPKAIRTARTRTGTGGIQFTES